MSTPAPEWMSEGLRMAWAEADAQKPKDIDTQLMLWIDDALDSGDAEEVKRLSGLRDELWQHEFNRPAPSPDDALGVPPPN